MWKENEAVLKKKSCWSQFTAEVRLQGEQFIKIQAPLKKKRSHSVVLKVNKNKLLFQNKGGVLGMLKREHSAPPKDRLASGETSGFCSHSSASLSHPGTRLCLEVIVFFRLHASSVHVLHKLQLPAWKAG